MVGLSPAFVCRRAAVKCPRRVNGHHIGCRQEGEIVFYASMNLAEANIMITEFEKRYPPIKVKLNRAGSEKLLTRVLANAAKVFIDFALSHEGQRLEQGFGRLVARTDLVSDQPAAIRQIKMVPVNPELAER